MMQNHEIAKAIGEVSWSEFRTKLGILLPNFLF